MGREPLDEPVGPALGAHEHEREIALAAELRDEGLDAVLVRHLGRTVLDLGICAPLPRAQLVDHRIRCVLLGQPSGLTVERGREEQRLAVPRAGADDSVDRGAEAHVEHPVGLVEDQGLDPVQSERAASEEILEPARGRDQHVGGRRGLGLLDQPGAAVDRGDAQRTGVRDTADVLDDLERQLAGRRQHERRRPRVGGLDPLDERDPERERLTGAGRGFGDHVPAGDRVADHGSLDCERAGDARL